jgi:hypothetical protein
MSCSFFIIYRFFLKFHHPFNSSDEPLRSITIFSSSPNLQDYKRVVIKLNYLHHPVLPTFGR